MCGITIIVDKSFSLSEKLIQKANETLKHRGPDVQQWTKIDFSWARVWLGHTRLSILDLSPASNQPFQQGDHALVFNGEIYNFRDLVSGVASDTQAIFKQLQPQGISDVVYRWNGMYALAWVDKKLERIQLLRDASGIKPLYAFEHPQYSVFTSELKVLKALGLAEENISYDLVQHYLTYKYFPAGSTPFKNTQSLKPGILYQMDKAGMQEKNIPIPSHQVDKGHGLVQDVEQLLLDSIEKHAISDVPVGLFLSGGIDSSLLAYMAAKKGLRMPAYTVAFHEVKSSKRTLDAEYAEQVAQRCGFAWRCLSLTEKDFWESDDWIQAMDMPVGDSAAWLTYRLSSFARKEVKAVWSGAGVDELFGGYNRHKAYRFYLKYGQRKIFYTPGRVISKVLPDTNKKFRLYKKFFNNVSDNPVQTWSDFCSMKLPLKQRSLATRKVIDLKAALLDDEKNYLVQDILQLSDTMSMAHSLEMRVPYLYQPLIKRVHGYSAEELMGKGSKWILRDLLKKYQGGNVLKRSKEGFGAPIGEWMKSPNGIDWLNTINEKHWISLHLNMTKWNNMKRAFIAGKLDLSQELMSLYVLDKWKK